MQILIGLTENFNLLLLSDTTLQRRLEIEATEVKTKEILQKLSTGELNLFDLPDEERRLVDFDKLLGDFLFKNQWEKLSPNSWQHLKTGNYLHISIHVEKETSIIKVDNSKFSHKTEVLWKGYYIDLWSPLNWQWHERRYVKEQNFPLLEQMLMDDIFTKNIKQSKI